MHRAEVQCGALRKRCLLRHCSGRRRTAIARRRVRSFGRKILASSSPRRTSRPLTFSDKLGVWLSLFYVHLTPYYSLTYYAVCKNHLQKILVSFVFRNFYVYKGIFYRILYIHNSMLTLLGRLSLRPIATCAALRGRT